MRGVEKLANVRRLYQTVAIDVCLFFYEALVFSATYLRFLFVKRTEPNHLPYNPPKLLAHRCPLRQ
jgi:hypothetical protein